MSRSYTDFTDLPRLSPWTPGLVPGVFACALMLAFVPVFSGGAVTPRWALLSTAVPLVLMFRSVPLGAAHLFCGLLLGWCAVTLAWTPALLDGIDALWKLALFCGLALIGALLPSLGPVYAGAAVGLAVSGVLALGGVNLFGNGNFMGEAAALVLVALVARRQWWLAAVVLPALVVSQARGAWLAVAVAAAVWLWPRRRIPALALVAGIVLVLILAGMRFDQDSGIGERVLLWIETASNLTPFGHGFGSFRGLFPSHAPSWDFLTSRPGHVHNDFLELAYEAGPGVLILLAFFGVALYRAAEPERLLLAALMTEMCFAFPLHLPATAFLAGVAVGHAVGLRDAVRAGVADGRMAVHADMGRGAARARPAHARRTIRPVLPA